MAFLAILVAAFSRRIMDACLRNTDAFAKHRRMTTRHTRMLARFRRMLAKHCGNTTIIS
ncbi:MAG TPA: hypothetical protein VN726_02505 [Hanamia sp.]|nr:hypothetical protein [Hanamia sp.]